MSILKIVYKLIKWFVLLLAFAYITISVLASLIDFLYVVYTIFGMFGINADIFFSTTERGSEEINSLFNTTYYNALYVISLISALLGMLVLSRKRSTLEAVAILLGFIIPPERKSWGRVVDSTTTRPVPFAAIYLEPLNAQNQVVRTIADSDGRYKLLIPDKKYNYNLLVRAPGYKDFHKELRIANSPVYGNEYIKDIFIHQVGKKKRSIFARFNYASSRLYWYLIIFLFAMSVFSFLSSLYYVYAYPGSVYGALSLGLYVFSVAWNIVMIKDRLKPKIGRVLDLKTRKPIADANIYIYKGDKQLEIRRTDSAGVVSSKLEPGEYEVRVAKEGYKSASEETFQDATLKPDGYFSDNLFLEQHKIVDEVEVDKNPFA